jgi:phosphate starvation-inducible PhoH-like protein
LKKNFKKDLLNFSKTFSFEDNLILQIIYGENDKFLDKIESSLKVKVITRGNIIKVEGPEENVNLAKKLLNNLYNLATKNNEIDEGEILSLIKIAKRFKSI